MAAKAIGTIGRPVAIAAAITPSLTTRAGPFGPSGVKTMVFPARASRMISRSAFAPPLVEEPRTDSTPYQSKTRAMYSPSFDCEMITVAGLCHFECSISSRWQCQKAMMYCGSEVRFFAQTWRTRSVACRPRIRSDPANAINFVFIR